MSIDLNKFVKGKHLKPADFVLDDASDLVSVKTDAASSVGAAIASAMLGATIPDATETVKGKVELATTAETTAGASTTLAVTPAGVAAAIAASTPAAPTGTSIAAAIAADAGAQTSLAASLADDLGATTAETIAGTEAVKFISPDDLKAALQSNAVYPLNVKTTNGFAAITGVNDWAAGTGDYKMGGYFVHKNSGSNGYGVEGVFEPGTSSVVTKDFLDTDGGGAISGFIPGSITVESGARVAATRGTNSAAGAGTKVGLAGIATPAGGTNIGLYGVGAGGAKNYAAYLDGETFTSGTSRFGQDATNVPGLNNTTTGAAIETFAGAGVIWASTDSVPCGGLNRNTDGPIFSLRRSGTVVGNIDVTTTGTTYNSVSDYRLKTVDGPLTTSGAFIDALQPKVGEWKAAPGKKAAFFIAHEVQAVSPSSVSGEKDAVDADGKAVMQAMEYGSAEFIVNIIAELQDLRKRVKALEKAK